MAAVGAVDPSVLASINGGGADATRGAADEIGTNFMTLLVTQLKNQDPLKPMENKELTSQLAQINTVNGIENLNKTLQEIDSQIGAGQQLQAAMLIGRGVMVSGDRVLVGDDGVSTPFGLELERAAKSVQVSLQSETGEIVRRFDLGAMPAGSDTLVWDGHLNNGELAPAGAYQVLIEARGEGGEPVPAVGLNYALVNGVSADASGEAMLDIGGVAEPVRLSDVRQIL